jgi:hypothetical protein
MLDRDSENMRWIEVEFSDTSHIDPYTYISIDPSNEAQ